MPGSKGFKPNLFHDPIREYAKPKSIEVRLNGPDEFVVLETVLHRMFEELGFTRSETDIQDDHTTFTYKVKGAKR